MNMKKSVLMGLSLLSLVACGQGMVEEEAMVTARGVKANAYVGQDAQVGDSCLAAGTMVAMADGEAVPVEGIQIGDAVHNPFAADSALLVSDTSKSFEKGPIVKD